MIPTVEAAITSCREQLEARAAEVLEQVADAEGESTSISIRLAEQEARLDAALADLRKRSADGVGAQLIRALRAELASKAASK